MFPTAHSGPLDFRADKTNKFIINGLPEKIAIVFAVLEFDGVNCQCEWGTIEAEQTLNRSSRAIGKPSSLNDARLGIGRGLDDNGSR